MQVKGLLALSVFLLVAAEAHAQPPKALTIEEIAARWKQRQDAAKTFRIAWTEAVLYPKGGYSEAYPSSTGKGVTFPGADRTLSEKGLVVMDDNKARFEFAGHAYSTHTNDFVDYSFAAMYDGKTGASLREIPEGGYTAVMRQTAGSPPRLSSAGTIPFLRAFRPSSVQLGGADLDKFQISGRTTTINSVGCIELTLRAPPSGIATFLWLDPTRDMHLIRYRQQLATGNYSLIQYDVEYSRDGAGRWIPSGWSQVKKSRSGGVIVSTKATVTECEVSGPIDAALFDTTPPKNSRVTEIISEGKTEQYIVRPDGSRREVVRGEESLPFRTLVETESGEPIGQQRLSWWTRNWVSLLGAAAFVMGLAGAMYWRVRSRRVPGA